MTTTPPTQSHRPPPKRHGDVQEVRQRAIRDQVVLDHLHLVNSIASTIRAKIPVHVDYNDLVQAGTIGLIDAAVRFDSAKQAVFSAYAKHRIRGAILDSLRELDWASRDMRRKHKFVESARAELTASLQRDPTESEIADKLGMGQEEWRRTAIDLGVSGPVSISSHSNEKGELPALEAPSRPETHPDYICGREQLRGVLGETVKCLPERYQKVVMMYYRDEMSMKEIGESLGINESRVSQIHKSVLGKLSMLFQAKGIDSINAFLG